MAAPKGNKNALGNKGGGRFKVGDLKKMIALFEGDIQFKDVHFKKNKNTLIFKSGYDALCYRVLTGDVAMLKFMMDKIYPDAKFTGEYGHELKQIEAEDIKYLSNDELDELLDQARKSSYPIGKFYEKLTNGELEEIQKELKNELENAH